VKKLGLIVNPIAGMGGKVGLKGTDGEAVLREARALGAEPESAGRAAATMKRLETVRDDIVLVTPPGEMGEDVARAGGFNPEVLEILIEGRTTAQHTREAATLMMGRCVNLVLFAGGDGTARDVVEAVRENQVSLGIPTGVKMHSAVFAVNPARAADLAVSYVTSETRDTRRREVMDIDEQALRDGRVSARLYGYLRTPFQPGHVQGLKAGSTTDEKYIQEAIAADVVENMEDGVCYIIGPGTTTARILETLGLDFTLVGVDLVRNKKLVGLDLNEKSLLSRVRDLEVRIIVTPIGGQGYLFGRGNQPISPRLIQRAGKDNIVLVATPQKINSLRGRPMLVDTGDPEVDCLLSGFYKITTGYRSQSVYRVAF
jgi:predicted polyphosphate/ATP-dependent NAD kinase